MVEGALKDKSTEDKSLLWPQANHLISLSLLPHLYVWGLNYIGEHVASVGVAETQKEK